MILWAIRVFLYLVILTLSLAIVGMIGRKENNVWNTTLPWNHTFVDFCAYEASTINPGDISFHILSNSVWPYRHGIMASIPQQILANRISPGPIFFLVVVDWCRGGNIPETKFNNLNNVQSDEIHSWN
ncbi:hypothetical protein Gasu2_13040 [Galdieria sulphuraria]|nr:hypothetical protein Gasu2_13040 [Galdieria sulphuraria]